MNFAFSIGDLVTILSIVGGIWRVERFFGKFLVEHEILVKDYCERHGLMPYDLPTRSRGKA
jgi:hypothetical protein